MYEVDDDFPSPPDEHRLWRYLDVGRFLALVQSRSLYFALITELDDPWEAAHPESLYRAIKTQHLDKDGNPTLAPLYAYLARSAVVSCWHENEGESIAMWSLYNSGKEGVAIQTTVERLKRVLSPDPRSILIGKVNYLDYERDRILPSNSVLSPLMHKRRSFQHEQEVRAVIAFPDIDAEGNELEPGSNPLNEFSKLPTIGIAIQIDLDILIERIIVSPKFPIWAIPGIQSAVDAAGLRVRVESSDLIRQPPVY